MEFSKFHGIWLYNQIPWNSMEFHGIPIPRWEVPWNSMNLRKFYGRWSDTKLHGIPWNSRATKWAITKFHRIPWNSGAAKCNITQFHGIPWNFEIVILINTMLSWTSMGYTMEFRGTLESPNKKSPSSMGFHGIRRAPLQMTQVFHGIPWNIPWNSMELWCRQMKYQLVLLKSMEYSMEFHGTLVPPNEVSFSSMEFHGTLRLSFYVMLPWTSKGYFVEFIVTLESTNKKSPSAMGFHGIRRAHFKWHKCSMEYSM